MILVPVKNLSAAKQRLAAVFDQPARTELAQAMLHDVVATIAAWPRRPACALVTSDPFAIELARQYDFETIPDPANPGEFIQGSRALRHHFPQSGIVENHIGRQTLRVGELLAQ